MKISECVCRCMLITKKFVYMYICLGMLFKKVFFVFLFGFLVRTNTIVFLRMLDNRCL